MPVEPFLQFADLLPEATLLVASDGGVLAANKAAARMGLSAAKPLADLVADPPDVVARFLHSCSRTRQMVPGSLRVRAAGGEVACRCEGAAYRPRSGDAPALVFLRLTPRDSSSSRFAALNIRLDEMAAEVRRRQWAEAEAVGDRERLRVTLSSIGDAVIATDPRGRVTFMNPVAEELTGWGVTDAAGRPLAEVFVISNEQTRRPVENPVARVLREGVVVGMANHTVLTDRGGREVPIDDSAAPIRGADGSIAGVVMVFRDVAEARQAAEARARLAAIVESSDEAIVSKTLDGVIRSWNAGAERIFGHSAAEAVGRPITLIIPPELVAEEREILARLRRGERIDHFETVRVTKDGRRIDISLTVSPVRDSEGNVVGASKVARDITSQKRAEEALREADRRKDEFLALLGHELRNPLAPIHNALQILELKGDDPAAAARARAMIARQSAHLTRLVDELLDASRVARGKVRLAVERLDLGELVKNVVGDHAAEAAGAGVSVEFAAPRVAVWVRGDAARLAQVATNLLNNAVKFTPAGGRVAVRVEGAGGEAALSVSDTGVGIAAEALPTLFQAFRQVDADPARTRGGLGLGLAVVRGLVELHGGQVEVASGGRGLGSTFTARLPLDAGVPAPERDTAPRGTAQATFSGRVVIIEDGADAADSLRELLELKGFEVSVARAGPEGVDLCRRLRPGGVVCDLGLPGMTGFGVARALRADPATAVAVLVAVSGYAQDDDRRKARDAGFDALLAKPADTDELARILTRATR